MKLTMEKLRALHPDTNGGDHSRVSEFTALMQLRRRVCRCGCGRPLPKSRPKKTRYFTHLHWIIHRRGQRAQRAIGLFVLLASLSAFAAGGSVTLAWDPTPSTNCTYVLYGTTNTVLTPTNAQIKVNCGTNLTMQATDIANAATWRFAVTAAQGALESDFSNQLILQVPVPPANTRSVALQYSGTLVGTNFLDALYLKLRIIP